MRRPCGYLSCCRLKQVIPEVIVREHGSAKVVVRSVAGRWGGKDAAELERKRLP